MAFFDEIKGPVVLKQSESLMKELNALETRLKIEKNIDEQIKIAQRIKRVRAGIWGEEAVLYELKSSYMPMMILPDLVLVQGDIKAQIDFLVITRHCHFVIECKNFYGDVLVDENNNFFRLFKDSKTGFYSPITQNRRHLAIIGQTLHEPSGTPRMPRSFYSTFRPLTVFTNDKTILYLNQAPRETRQQIIRADSLITYMRIINTDKKAPRCSERKMKELAEFFLAKHSTDVQVKDTEDVVYSDMPESNIETIEEMPSEEILCEPANQQACPEPLCPKCNTPMVRRKSGISGEEFWGCQNYPACRGTRRIAEVDDW